jgi:hypothetical protein
MAKLSSILNSSLAKILKKLFLFSLLFFVINLGLSYTLSKAYFASMAGNSGAQINYFLSQRNPVVIFGASRAQFHYIPQIIQEKIGLKTYNAGCDGMNSTYQLGLLEMLLNQYKPKLIIYEAGDYLTYLKNGITALTPYYYQYDQVKEILNQQDKYAPYKFKLHLYAYNQKVFTIFASYLQKSRPNVSGYKAMHGSILQEEINFKQYEAANSVEPELDPSAFQDFKRFIELCKKNNIPLILVNSPRFFDEHFKYTNLVDTLVTQYDIKFFDYANNPNYVHHRELFYDGNHLNNTGAELFSKELGEELHEYLSNTKKNTTKN